MPSACPSSSLTHCLLLLCPSQRVLCSLFQNGGLAWSDDADGGRGREISRDFAKVCGHCILGDGEESGSGRGVPGVRASRRGGLTHPLPSCSCMNWTVTLRGGSSWTTSSSSCRRGVSAHAWAPCEDERPAPQRGCSSSPQEQIRTEGLAGWALARDAWTDEPHLTPPDRLIGWSMETKFRWMPGV